MLTPFLTLIPLLVCPLLGAESFARAQITNSRRRINSFLNSPENDENITGYDVTTTVPGYDTTIPTSTTSLEFVEVPDGVYTFTVRSISARGRQSRPVSVTVAIEDYFGGNHVREKGVLKGGIVSCPSVVITTQGAKEFKYETDPVFFFSPNDTTSSSKSLTFSGGAGLDYDILSTHRLASWFNDSFLNDDEAFVFLSNYKNSGRELRLINHVMDPLLNVDYWYDQSKAIQKNYNLNETQKISMQIILIFGLNNPDKYKLKITLQK